MAFARWDPLQDLLALHERIHRLAGQEAPGWTPAVDLYETNEHYVIAAELPGLSREAIRMQVQDGTFVLQGERQAAHEPHVRFHRVERGHGPFRRAFRLPQPIDADKISAEFLDGVLTVTVPKVPARQIRIDVK